MFDPWAGKFLWEQQSTPVFLPGELHGQRSLAGYSPWGPKELGTAQRLTQSTVHMLPPMGPGHGGTLPPVPSKPLGLPPALHYPAAAPEWAWSRRLQATCCFTIGCSQISVGFRGGFDNMLTSFVFKQPQTRAARAIQSGLWRKSSAWHK